MQTRAQKEDVVIAIEELVQSLVDQPGAAAVRPVHAQQLTILEVRGARSDHGKILGRNGRTIDAIRQILVGISGAQGRRFTLELIEPDDLTSSAGGFGRKAANVVGLPNSTHVRKTMNLADTTFEDDPIETTGRLLTNLVRLLVDDVSAVAINVVQGRQVAVFEVSVDPSETRRIIGIRGRLATAIRELLTNLGARVGLRFLLEIVEPIAWVSPGPLPDSAPR